MWQQKLDKQASMNFTTLWYLDLFSLTSLHRNIYFLLALIWNLLEYQHQMNRNGQQSIWWIVFSLICRDFSTVVCMFLWFIDMYQSCIEILVRCIFEWITENALYKQRKLLMKKQQKRRTNVQMITANHDARPKNCRKKPAAEDTALLISQSQSNTSLNGKQA